MSKLIGLLDETEFEISHQLFSGHMAWLSIERKEVDLTDGPGSYIVGWQNGELHVFCRCRHIDRCFHDIDETACATMKHVAPDNPLHHSLPSCPISVQELSRRVVSVLGKRLERKRSLEKRRKAEREKQKVQELGSEVRRVSQLAQNPVLMAKKLLEIERRLSKLSTTEERS